MRKPLLQHVTILIAVALTASALSACGSSSMGSRGAIPSGAVVVVGDTPITKANLNHWMQTVIGGDFYERVKKRAPVGLVAEPANYPACISASETIVAGSPHKSAFTKPDYEEKCRQLYESVKEQALGFMISVQWRVNEASEAGIELSDADIARYARELNARDFPHPGELAAYLANRRWIPSDQLYQFKRNLLTIKLKNKINAADNPKAESEYVHFVSANLKKRKAETSCRPTYLALQCRQFKSAPAGTPAPNVTLEELVLGERLPH